MFVKLLIIFAAMLLGICAFAVSGGALIFAALFLKKGAKNRARKKTHNARARGTGALFAHLDDPKIAPVMSAAKERWDAGRGEGKIEQVSVMTKRGLTLKGYAAVPAKTPPLFVALLIHDYGGCASDMAYLAEEYLSRGAAVLAVDCRAHGESGGEIIGMGYADARDIEIWFDFLLKRFGKDTRIALHGVSMGAAAVMRFTALKKTFSQAGNIAAVIADCGFSSSRRQFFYMAELVIGKSPAQKTVCAILFFGISVINFMMTGYFLFQNSPAHALKKRRNALYAPAPLVLFHGENDLLVKAEMLNALVKAAGGKNVIAQKIKDAPHAGSYFYAPERYMQTIFAAIGA